MAAASLALACCLAWARPAASSRLHAVTVRPPASYEDRRHGDAAFHRDAVRDRMLFGFLDSGYSEAELTPSYSEAELTPSYKAPRTPRSSAQVPALRRDKRPHYTSISREEICHRDFTISHIGQKMPQKGLLLVLTAKNQNIMPNGCFNTTESKYCEVPLRALSGSLTPCWTAPPDPATHSWTGATRSWTLPGP